jgi:hypothetical protein
VWCSGSVQRMNHTAETTVQYRYVIES